MTRCALYTFELQDTSRKLVLAVPENTCWNQPSNQSILEAFLQLKMMLGKSHLEHQKI